MHYSAECDFSQGRSESEESPVDDALDIMSEQHLEQDMRLKLTKVFQKVPEGYIGFVEELPGANTQGDTLEDVKANLEEAIEMVMEANRELAEETLKGQDVIREPVYLSFS